MKKRYLLLAVLVAVILLVPKFVSTKVTDVVNNVAAELSTIDGYSAKVVEFNEGWFNSTGTIRFTIDLAQLVPDNEFDADQQMPQLDVKVTSSHGPVFFGPAMGLGLAHWSLVYEGDNLRDVLTFDENKHFYEFSSTYGFFGGGTFEDSFPAFTLKAPEKDNAINFSGYAGKGTYSDSNLSYDGNLASLEATGETGDIQVKNVSLEMDSAGNFMEALAGAINDSKVSFLIESIQFVEKDNATPNFLMQNMAMIINSDVNEEETLLDLTQSFSVAKIDAMDYAMSDLTFNYELNNLSVPFFQAYQEFAKTIQATSEEDMQMQTLAFLQENAVMLLKADPQLKITDFSGILPEGQFNMTGDVQLTGVEALPAVLTDPQFWVAHMAALIDFSADKAVAQMVASNYMQNQLANNPQTAGMTAEELEQIAVQQSPMMLDSLTQQGLMIEKDGKLTLNFMLKDSQATLNGNPMPLPF